MAAEVEINDACDYVIERLSEAREHMNVLKLQKLMYYVQAWSLAFYGQPLFQGKFQAWVHGPVNRLLYDRFVATKSLYSDITQEDVRTVFDGSRIPEDARSHIESVLEVYAGYTGSQLEDMTHREDPWMKARVGLRQTDRCEIEIEESLMASYYRDRVRKEESDA